MDEVDFEGLAQERRKDLLKRWAPIFTLALICIVISISYALVFWPAPLSKRPQDWAHFSDFIGGLFTPLISIWALHFLVQTYRNTKKDLAVTRQALIHQNFVSEYQLLLGSFLDARRNLHHAESRGSAAVTKRIAPIIRVLDMPHIEVSQEARTVEIEFKRLWLHNPDFGPFAQIFEAMIRLIAEHDALQWTRRRYLHQLGSLLTEDESILLALFSLYTDRGLTRLAGQKRKIPKIYDLGMDDWLMISIRPDYRVAINLLAVADYSTDRSPNFGDD